MAGMSHAPVRLALYAALSLAPVLALVQEPPGARVRHRGKRYRD